MTDDKRQLILRERELKNLEIELIKIGGISNGR
jgi:hypothetical protein